MSPPGAETLNPLAEQLNSRLQQVAPETYAMLSAFGRRLYFPRGILSQSAEAKAKGKRFNATVGIATEGGGPMHLPSVQQRLGAISPSDAYSYAPPAGRMALRERWREKLLAENPALVDKQFGLPVATVGITHGLSLVADLFVDPGDCILLPHMFWGNYRLLYEQRCGAQMQTFPLFESEGFACEAFRDALAAAGEQHEKVVVLLNFPNNPTGYMPTASEANQIVTALEEQAKRGTRIVAVCDDAYFGLFYDIGTESLHESIFGMLANRHPNLLAIKLDGATKEFFVWGFRCGFMTIASGDLQDAAEVHQALDAKLRGAIRSNISNGPQLSQSLVEEALGAPAIKEERQAKASTLRARAHRVNEVVRGERFSDSWQVYPFNSGYFMCIRLKGVNAEQVRLHLLDRYETGVIASGKHDLRIAFSCLEVDEVEPLFETIHKAVLDLRK